MLYCRTSIPSKPVFKVTKYLIHMERRAVGIMKPSIRRRGDRPNRFNSMLAMRLQVEIQFLFQSDPCKQLFLFKFVAALQVVFSLKHLTIGATGVGGEGADAPPPFDKLLIST